MMGHNVRSEGVIKLVLNYPSKPFLSGALSVYNVLKLNDAVVCLLRLFQV